MAGREYRDSYQLFSSGGLDFIVVDLEINPPSAVVTWANGILATYASRRAIVVTHDYLTGSGTRSSVGESLWTNLVSGNCNVFMVLSGHASEEAQLTSTRGASCQPVYQILQDYQGRTNGGDGWLRYYTFKPSQNTDRRLHLEGSAGSHRRAVRDRREQPVQPRLRHERRGRLAGHRDRDGRRTPAGTRPIPWNGLAGGTPYEWYATVERRLADDDGRDVVVHDRFPATMPPSRSRTAIPHRPGYGSRAPWPPAGVLGNATVHASTVTSADLDERVHRRERRLRLQPAPAATKLRLQPYTPAYRRQLATTASTYRGADHRPPRTPTTVTSTVAPASYALGHGHRHRRDPAVGPTSSSTRRPARPT